MIVGDGSEQNNPNALHVKFSIEHYSQADAGDSSYVQILGVPLDVLKASANYNGSSIKIDGGFWRPSIPLGAKQSLGSRQGNLIDGTIFSSFGNWRGTDITLDLLLMPGSGSVGGVNAGGAGANSGSDSTVSAPTGAAPHASSSRLMRRKRPSSYAPRPQQLDDSGMNLGDIGGGGSGLSGLGDFLSIGLQLASTIAGGGFRQPNVNLIHNALPGMPFTIASQLALKTAYPGMNINAWFTSALMLAYQDSGFYQNLQQYASYLKSIAMQKLGGRGIDTYVNGKDITLTDWQGDMRTVSLDYSDLIGQPTWIDLGQIQFDCVMRADLMPPCNVILPVTLMSVGSIPEDITGIPSMLNTLTFNGQFKIFKIRHVGDSRSKDGKDWRTSCWAIAGNLPSNFGAFGTKAIASAAFDVAQQALNQIEASLPIPSISRFNKRKMRVW
jgi:hypothetical protein